MSFYFEQFEHKTPPPPLPHSVGRELLWQFLVIMALTFGAWYLYWRWTASLNPDALWFAIPLVVAETFAYFGLMLFAFNLWKTEDYPWQEPPRTIGECTRPEYVNSTFPERPLSVDVYIPTYNEDPELIRFTIRDAKKITYPHPMDMHVYVLDDGKREPMKIVAEEESVGYLTRNNNIGFKAGNLRNAMEHTTGDFILICDADSRPFPQILERTLGYFKDPDVAWVQTPQWFYDLPEGRPLKEVLNQYLSRPGYWIGAAVERIAGPIQIGYDRFANDPKLFFDIIERRRNWANASFCCGAGSVHRREAVMEAAMKTYFDAVEAEVQRQLKTMNNEIERIEQESEVRRHLALETEVTPYKFHVSEDIYTSLVLHGYENRRWKSVHHPEVLSKMLSPQDLLSWTIQRFKYAGGSLDIFFHDNPIFGNNNMTPVQRLMYLATFYSYLAGLWNVVFLIAPVIYLFTGIAPVACDSREFFIHFLPFIIINELAFMVGMWGIPGWTGLASFLSFFPINLQALWTVLRGKKISFHVTPKVRQEGSFIRLVLPQVAIVILTISGLIYSGVMIALGKANNYAGFFTNLFWGTLNIAAMSGIIAAAFWQPPEE